jgi:hypothetical protein
MTTWICDGCGVEHTDSDVRPPESGCVFTSEVVSMEERGDLGPHGTWTTLAELAAQPHQTEHVDHGRGVHSLRRVPRFAIGHRTFVVQTGHGNLLWDAPGYLDDDIVSLVRGLGGVAVIAASHPHMFGAQLSWSREFGDVPVYVNALDQEWLPRTDPVIELWKEQVEPLPGVRLIHVGGHMRGSCVALTADVRCSSVTPSPVGWPATGCRSSATFPGTCRCRLRWCDASLIGSNRSTTTGSTPLAATRSTGTPRG